MSSPWIVVCVFSSAIAIFYVTTISAIGHTPTNANDNQRRQEILSNYSRSALLFRGEAMCNDGCTIFQLENTTFTLKIKDTLNVHENGNETKIRNILFPNCNMRQIHKFGLGPKGKVYVSRYDFYPEQHEEICIIEEGPFYAILLEDIGRLKFI